MPRTLRVQAVLGLIEDDRGCAESMTSSVTSSPRCAGRQCMKIAAGSASAMSARVHRVAREVATRAACSASWPIDAHVSVTTMSAPGDGFARVCGDHERRASAGLRGELTRVGDDALTGSKPRSGDGDVHPGERSADEVRVGHVVAVADVRQRQALQRRPCARGS